MTAPPPRGRRTLRRARRSSPEAGAAAERGWEHTVEPLAPTQGADADPSLPLQRITVLALFSDPRIDALRADQAARLLLRPLQDVEVTLEAMVSAGQLLRDGSPTRYQVPIAHKQQLEQLFRDSARELGVTRALVPVDPEGLPAPLGEDEEPRLPVTAGLLSLFLPGTGQLLNGDVGRASLVFAVFSLAWITHLSPVWTFVCLYAGAEAFFTAKIRGLERRMAREALQAPPAREALPPRPM